MDYIKQQTEYFASLPCKNDCDKLFNETILVFFLQEKIHNKHNKIKYGLILLLLF